jgi:hydroxyacylglutathione hydrolase
MTAPKVIPVVDEGLGNSAYLVDLGAGRGLAVDAARDLRALRAAAALAGLRIAYAADTHLHADFLSGAVQLAATDGATVLASATGGREFPHTGLADGDEVDLGGLRLRALATPGHTPEHAAFLLLDPGGAGTVPVGVFTGGSLLVGSAARTDLAGADRTGELARAQYASLTRLLTLPDATAVWPTHGAGSFCSAPPGADRVTTIGRERAGSPLLTSARGGGGIVDEATFVARLLAGLGTYPAYFARLPEANRRGPGVVGEPVRLPPLDAAAFAAEVGAGAQVVDVRAPAAFAAGHVPGALSITLRAVFATWLGWLVDPARRIVVVRDPGQDPDEIVWQALKVGYENLAGQLAGGMAAWTRAGHPVATITLVSAGEIGERAVLDIRQDGEYVAGHVPGAVHVELGALTDPATALGRVPDGPLLVMCGHGERAMTAASLLARAGRTGLAVLDGGPGDWSTATGAALAAGTGR